MSDINPQSNSPKRRSWLRKLLSMARILAVLLVVAYFAVTSSTFFKRVILPRVSRSLGATLTVSDARISPFSHVLLRDLKVQPPAGETLLTVREVRLNYSLAAIIGGTIAVSEIAIESPVITIVENSDGTGNLDAFTKAQAKGAKPAPPAGPKPARPARVDIGKLALNNATVRLVKLYPNGGRDAMEVTRLNFSISGLKNGQPGTIALAAVLAVDKAAQTNAAAGALQAGLNGGFEFSLTPDLKPASSKGGVTFKVGQAAGSLAELDAFAAKLDCELTATELKELVLRLSKADNLLAKLRASGPFDTAKSEGKLKVELVGIDRQALNLAGAAGGMDFGTTTVNSSSDIELGKGGSFISLAGRFEVARFQVKREAQITPTLDLRGDYAVTLDRAASLAVLQTLNLTGKQDSRALLTMGLSSPMTIAWGAASGAVGDAVLNLAVTDLNLADWKAFAGKSVPEGVVNVVLKLVSQKAGKQLAFDLNTRLDKLATGDGAARVEQGDLQLQARGSLADMKQLNLNDYQLDVVRQGCSALKVSGSATFDSATQDADLQVALQTALAQWLVVPGGNPTNGALGFQGRVTNKQKKVTLAGELTLPPVARAKNILQLDGSADLSHPDAITGSLKIAAESLDVTACYDLLSVTKPAATGSAPAAAAPAADPNKEPDAVKMPLKTFTVDLNVGRLFLREVDIANWQTTALLDGGRVVLKPCQLTLNGAPIKASADLDLGVPGYTYDVAFDAGAIPLAPLVNSFAPDRKGQIAGTTSIGVLVKGAGVTGAGLQKNLAGQFGFAATNLDLSIANVRSPLMSTVINVIVGIPDLIRNPVAALGNLLGAGSQKSGFADALTASPIEAITAQAGVGEGTVRLQSAEARSAAFQALAAGRLVLAPVLTNSTMDIPVRVTLSRSLAGQIGLVGADTPTNAVYVALPDFLKLQGTLGQPKAKIDKLVLVELAAKTGGGVLKQFEGSGGGKTSSLLNSVGALLGGGKSTTTNSSPATNRASPVSDLLKLFNK